MQYHKLAAAIFAYFLRRVYEKYFVLLLLLLLFYFHITALSIVRNVKIRFLDYSLTWTESEAVCIQEGGHLASIYDEVEQDFIVQLVHRYHLRNVCIGLNELRSVNTYEWTDGQPVTF